MANEKRLIDANALKEKKIPACTYDKEDGIQSFDVVYVRHIDEAPTVDAVEVVHGRWIEKDDMVASYLEGCAEVFYECSACRSPNYGETNYCPNCGAKMDGGKK